MTPVLERIVSEKDSGFILAKVNAKTNPKTVVKNSVRSTPSVRIYHNGKMVDGFSGGRLEHQVRNLMTQVIESPPPIPNLKLSDDPNQRYKQARSHLKKGRGLEAAVALRDISSGANVENAARLLPLAQFIWDLDDGDRWTGKRKIDDLYHLALDGFDDKKPANALEPLRQTLDMLPKDARPEMERVIEALEFLVR